MRAWAYPSHYLTALLLVLFFGLHPWLDAQNAPQPNQSLYRIQAQATQTGWTTDLHQQAGDLYERMDNTPAMIAHWEAANTQDAARLERLGRAYIRLEEWTAAYDTFAQILIQAPTNTTAYYYMGLILSARDPLRARPALEIAAQNLTYASLCNDLLAVMDGDTRDNRYPLQIGQVLMQYDQRQLAEYALHYAAAFTGKAEAYAYVAILRQAQDERSSYWMQQGLLRGQRNPTVAYLNGLYLRRNDDYKASLQEFSRAVLLQPENPALYAEMGKAHELLFQYESAEHWLTMAVDISDNDPRYASLLASFYINSGYGTLDNLRNLRQDMPEDPSLIAGIGWQLYNNGNLDEGIAEIDYALSIDPNNAEALYYKARTLLNVGQVDAARPFIQRLVDEPTAYTSWANNMLAILLPP
jgi:tetratricopeptide (TPR) repeat protein